MQVRQEEADPKNKQGKLGRTARWARWVRWVRYAVRLQPQKTLQAVFYPPDGLCSCYAGY